MPSTRPTRSRFAATLALLLAFAPQLAAAHDTPLSRDDIAWLQRDGYGVDSASIARYRELGRDGLLDAQLHDRLGDNLPAPIATLIDSYEVARTPATQLAESLRQQRELIKAMPDGEAKVAAKKILRRHGEALADQARETVLLQAIYGANPLKEQMVWFWLNHFSIYANKGGGRWLAGDYAQHTIRPHALGKFRDLVMATLQSPAMLQYLDNAQNAKDKVNENYARELMELHTLGVGAGYSQHDVQQLALILTGVGLARAQSPATGEGRAMRRRAKQNGALRDGLFAFNPRRHDFSDKTLLGHSIRGSGFDEVAQAIDLITRQPACAQFISRQLAEYFVADKPPPALVARMAQTFQRSDGDIAAVLRTLFESKELLASHGGKFKDPMQFLVSSMRVTLDGQPITNPQPLVAWLNQMGEPLFGRLTPDGWPLDGAAWSSSGQMTRRFEIARAIGSGRNRLFAVPEPATVPDEKPPVSVPPLGGPPYELALAPQLSARTRDALAQATSKPEWNTFVLSSPEFNYR